MKKAFQSRHANLMGPMPGNVFTPFDGFSMRRINRIYKLTHLKCPRRYNKLNGTKTNTLEKSICMVIWTALTTSVFFYPPFLDSGYPVTLTDNPVQFTWVPINALVLLFISNLIRWIVVPKVIQFALTIPLLIIGLAPAESTVFFEIFLLEDDSANEKALIYWLAVSTMVGFCPLFINRTSEPPAIKNF